MAFFSASFVFNFISFSNIMLLYIFLDIGLINSGIRASLEEFARLLLTDGLIVSLAKVMDHPVPGFLQRQLNISNRIPDRTPVKGSYISILGISTQSSKLCVDDCLVMLVNILKICFVWAVGVHLSKKQMFAKFIKPKQLGSDSYKAIVYEITAPAPLWTLVSGVILSAEQENINATNFIDKLNNTFLVNTPAIFLLMGVSWFRHRKLAKVVKNLDE